MSGILVKGPRRIEGRRNNPKLVNQRTGMLYGADVNERVLTAM